MRGGGGGRGGKEAGTHSHMVVWQLMVSLCPVERGKGRGGSGRNTENMVSWVTHLPEAGCSLFSHYA